jgi:hypothetical protein
MIGGVHLSAGRGEAKAARLEASSRVGGNNQAGRHRRTVSRAKRVRWAGREAEAQWGEAGEQSVGEKKMCGPRLGQKGGWAESDGKILFQIKFDF